MNDRRRSTDAFQRRYRRPHSPGLNITPQATSVPAERRKVVLEIAVFVILISLDTSRASAGHRMDSEERAWYLSDNIQGALFLTIGMLEPIALPIHVPLHYGQRLGSDGVGILWPK
jgi:hypothetical protein